MMENNIFNTLNERIKVEPTTPPPSTHIPKQNNESALNKPIFKVLGELLYDTVVASTKEYIAETEAAGANATNAFIAAQKGGVPIEYFDDMAMTPR